MFARALVALVLACAAAPFAAAQFTAGNIAVLRIGDGTTDLSTGVGVAGSVLQFNSAGSNTATVSLNPGVLFNGASTFEGGLHRSADGTTLTFAGYANTSTNLATVTNRVVGRIGADTSLSYQTITSGPGTGANTGANRSVASIDGGQVWVAAGVGVVTASGTGTAYSAVSSFPTSLRDVNIFGTANSLFTSRSSTPDAGVYMVGSGAAPTSPTTSTLVLAGNQNQNPTGFWMTSRGAPDYAGTGLDTAYVLNGGTILKYEYDGAAWNLRTATTVAKPAGAGVGALSGVFITGREQTPGGAIELYATFDLNGVTANNYLIRLTDTNSFAASNPVDLNQNWSVPAGTNYSFRGLDSTPSVTPEPAAVLGLAALGLGAVALVRRKL